MFGIANFSPFEIVFKQLIVLIHKQKHEHKHKQKNINNPKHPLKTKSVTQVRNLSKVEFNLNAISPYL